MATYQELPFISPNDPEIPIEPIGDSASIAFKWKGKISDLALERMLRQLHGVEKASKKLPSWIKAGVAFPAALSIEQCSSEATALYKKDLLQGDDLIDLTGGFGVDSWAFSSAFNQVTYVEQNPELCRHAAYNFNQLSIDNIQLVCENAESFLKSFLPKNNVAFFVDPARRNHSQKVFLLKDCEPRLDLLWSEMRKITDQILVKLSPILDIRQLESELQEPLKIHVVSVDNECKEILIQPSTNSSIVASMVGSKKYSLAFTPEEERLCEVQYAAPLKYLYEPDVAILKAGAFKLIADKFQVFKLAPHSHLYTSEKPLEDFPGRIFEVKNTLAYTPKVFKKEKRWIQANVTVRNFPMEVADIKKQCGIKDGGEHYLFATTLLDKSLSIVECTKIKGL